MACPQSFTETTSTGIDGTYTFSEVESNDIIKVTALFDDLASRLPARWRPPCRLRKYCYFTFAPDDTTVRGTCTYNDLDGTLVPGSGTDPLCPLDAVSQCQRKRSRPLTKLEAIIRCTSVPACLPAREAGVLLLGITRADPLPFPRHSTSRRPQRAAVQVPQTGSQVILARPQLPSSPCPPLPCPSASCSVSSLLSPPFWAQPAPKALLALHAPLRNIALPRACRHRGRRSRHQTDRQEGGARGEGYNEKP